NSSSSLLIFCSQVHSAPSFFFSHCSADRRHLPSFPTRRSSDLYRRVSYLFTDRQHIIMCWVPPFGNLRFNAYLQLPEAYRCWFRPSSALNAKASTVRPSLLNRNEVVSVPPIAAQRVFVRPLFHFSSRFSTL